ncbi:MAG TPA: Rrf2 family transcriptional regulator [Candidatus Deferrimicrobiaceae bacterium]|nr:Rrf2 family transcriptional regulator [Candidatus Deferrimicrobiaceae bacterium]
MRLSKKTEYAFKALIYAARYPEGTSFQIKELAEKNGIPKKFLELILLDLKNAGIVQSKRGVGGGYLLSRRPQEIRSSEIIEAIEGPIAPTTVRKGRGKRPVGEDSSFAVSRLLRETCEAIESALARWTLADLAREEREAAERRQRNLMYFI